MANEVIFKNIKKGLFKGVSEDIKEYLTPLLHTETKSDLPVKSLVSYAATLPRLLYETFTTADKWSKELFPQLIESVHLCCKCITEVQQNVKDPVAIMKLVYHYIMKLHKMDGDMLYDMMKLSEFLYLQIIMCPEAKANQASFNNISGSIYSILWNSAVKGSGELPLSTVYQSYTLALKFFSISGKSPDRLVDNALKVIMATTATQNSADQLNSTRLVVNFVDSIVCILKEKSKDLNETSEEYDNHLHAILEIQQFEIRYFSSCGQIKQAKEICDLCQEFLNELDEEKSNIASAYRVCCRLMETCYYLDSNSLSNDSSEFVKKLSCDISTCVEMIRQPLVLNPLSLSPIAEALLQLKMQLENTYGVLSSCSRLSLPLNLHEPFKELFKVTLSVLHQQKLYLVEMNSNGDPSALKKLQIAAYRIVEVTSSQLYMEAGFMKAKQLKVSNDECCSKVTDCEESLKKMKEVLDEISLQGFTPAIVKRYHMLIYVANRLGGCFHARKLFKEAMVFYELAVKHWDFIKNDASAAGKSSRKETSVWIWHIYEASYDGLNQLKQHQKAVDAIVQGFLADMSRVSEAVKAWCQVKSDSMEDDGFDIMKSKTFHQFLLDKKCDLCNVNAIDLLEQELKICKNKHRLFDEVPVVIKDLLCIVTDTEKRVRVLIQKTQWLWMKKGEDSESWICLNGAIGLLEGLAEKDRGIGVQVLFAGAFLWKYIIKSAEGYSLYKKEMAEKKEREEKKKKEKEAKSGKSTEGAASDKPTSEDTDSQALLKLQDEADLLVSVDQALKYSTTICNDNAAIDHVDEMLEILNICGSIYALRGKPIKELCCLSLLSSLLKRVNKKTAELIRTESRRVIILTNLRQLEAASIILAKLSDDATCMKVINGGKDVLTTVRFLLTKAELYLVSDKIQEGFRLLEEVNRQRANFCAQELTHYTLWGWFKRLLAQYLSLLLHEYGVDVKTTSLKYTERTSPLINLSEAVVQHVKVVMSLVGWKCDPSVEFMCSRRYCSLIEQWNAIDELLTSEQTCLNHMIMSGDVRQSSYHYREAAQLAYAFGLPKRSVQFRLEMTKLCALQHDVRGAKHNLAKCHAILNYPEDVSMNTTDEETGKYELNPATSSRIKDSDFGFDWDNENNDCRETNPSPPFEDLPTLSEVCRCLSDCSCVYCQDVTLQQLRVDHLIVYSESSFLVGGRPPDVFLVDLQRVYDYVQSKIYHCMKEVYISCSTNSELKLPSCPSDSFLKLQQVKIHVQNCQGALSNGSVEFTNFANKALGLLSPDVNADMASQSRLLAEVFYLLTMGTLQRAQIETKDGSVDDLADRITDMRLDADVKKMDGSQDGVMCAKLAKMSISDPVELEIKQGKSKKDTSSVGKNAKIKKCNNSGNTGVTNLDAIIEELENAANQDLFIEECSAVNKRNSVPSDTSSGTKKEDSSASGDALFDQNNEPKGVTDHQSAVVRKNKPSSAPSFHRRILEMKGSKIANKSPRVSSIDPGEVITASYRTPARRIRKGKHLVNQDSPALKSAIKKLGKSVKKSVSFEPSGAQHEDDFDVAALAELRQMLKTPVNIGRRQALDLLMASGSDDDSSCFSTAKSMQRQRVISTASASARTGSTTKARRVKSTPKPSDMCKVAKAISFDLEDKVEDPFALPTSPLPLPHQPAVTSASVKKVVKRRGTKSKVAKELNQAAEVITSDLSDPLHVFDLPESPVLEKKNVRGKARRVPVRKNPESETTEALSPASVVTSPLKPKQSGRGRSRRQQDSNILSAKSIGEAKQGKNVIEEGMLDDTPRVASSGGDGKRKGLSVEAMNQMNIPDISAVSEKEKSTEILTAKVSKGSGTKENEENLPPNEMTSSDAVVGENETCTTQSRIPKPSKGTRRKKSVKTIEVSSPLKPRLTRGRAKEQVRSNESDDICDLDLWRPDLELCEDVNTRLKRSPHTLETSNEPYHLEPAFPIDITQEVDMADMLVDEQTLDSRLSSDEEVIFRCDEEDSKKGAKKSEKLREMRPISNLTVKSVRTVQRKNVSTIASIQPTMLSSPGVKEQLLQSFNLIRHNPPFLLYRSVCHALALCTYKDDPWEAAFYLSEAINTSIRHQAIVNSANRKRRSAEKEDGCREEANFIDQKVAETLFFDKDVASLKTFVSSLPPSWVICQLSVVEIPVSGQLQLFLTRLQNGEEPIVMLLPGFTNLGADHIAYFKNLVGDVERLGNTESDLKKFIDMMEADWFGRWKGLSLGQLTDEDAHSRIKNLARKYHNEGMRCGEENCSDEKNAQLLEILLSSSHTLKVEEAPEPLRKHIKKVGVLRLVNKNQKREPVLLIVDKQIQMFPFENMPVLEGYQVSRMFSLHMLNYVLTRTTLEPDNIYNKGIDKDKVFYVLNPDGNLADSQKRMIPFFKSFNWSGICGVQPTQEQYKAALTSQDMFVYSGHGCGSKYFGFELLQATKCRAFACLFGCSSAVLDFQGATEGSGPLIYYFLGGATCVMGNLWKVGDKSMDLITQQLFNLWLNKAKPGACVLDFISPARKATTRRYQTGAATVCYGLPIRTMEKHNEVVSTLPEELPHVTNYL